MLLALKGELSDVASNSKPTLDEFPLGKFKTRSIRSVALKQRDRRSFFPLRPLFTQVVALNLSGGCQIIESNARSDEDSILSFFKCV